jgi:hypothetical protein
MAKFEPGHKLAKGRPKGAVNRSTEMMKVSIARATNRVLDDLPKIMEEMVKKDPKAAVDLAIKLLEFHLPKMSRIEMRAEVEQRIQQITVNINQTGSNERTND